MTSTPRISIVTPTLNQGRYIAATIHSVMDQGYPDLEYTIIDGGSTDNTHEVVAKLRAEYSNAFQFEIVKGMGQVAAINKGLAAATGEILAYINSDDLYLPGVFRTVTYHFHNQPHAKWLSAPSIFFGENCPNLKIMPSVSPAPDLANWLFRNFTPQPSVFWTREAYSELGSFDEKYKYRFDHEYWLRFVARGYAPIHLGCPLSAYRLHATSFTCTRQNLFLEELTRIRSEWIPKLVPREQGRLRRLIRRGNAQKLHERALQTASDGNRVLGLCQWFAGTCHSPLLFLELMTYLSLRRVLFPKMANMVR